MSNTMKTIDDLLDNLRIVDYDAGYGGIKHIKQNIVGKRKLKQALSTMLGEIIEPNKPITTIIGKGSISNGIEVFINDLKAKQRQRAADRGFIIDKKE